MSYGRFKLRRDAASAWTAANPVLAAGEIALETDATPYKLKIGDGATAWASLAYWGVVSSTSISDSTTVGRAVLTASDAAAARTAIGAGTSSFSGDYADLSDNPTLGTAAGLNVPASGNAASGEVVKGDDTRLTNARTPSAHNQALSTITQSGASTGQTIEWNGSAWVPVTPSGGGGGGGLTGFTSALNIASPNNTINVSSLIASGGTTNQDVVYGAKGDGAVLGQVPDGTATGGNRRGTLAVDFQRVRDNSNQVASGSYSVIISGWNNRVTGYESAIITGTGNTVTGYRSGIFTAQSCTVSGNNSVIAGGINNSVSNDLAGVFSGDGNSATGSRSVVLTGNNNSSTNASSVVCGGYANTASASASFVGAGSDNRASGIASFITGGIGATTRGHVCASAHASGKFSAQGDAQGENFVLRRITSDSTTLTLTADGDSYLPDRIPTLPDNSFYEFEVSISARQNTTGDGAAFKIVGAIKRGAGAGTTVIVGTPTVTSVGASVGASAWTAVADADTSIGALAINVTGQTSKSIKWVARVQTVEVVG